MTRATRMYLCLGAIVVATVLLLASSFVTESRMREHGDERYLDGVRDGQCERDCQYTHDGGMMTNVTGRANAADDCFCTRWLGEPDWEHYPP